MSKTQNGGRTDDPLHFGHQATGWRWRGFLRKVTGVQDVVHRRAVLAVVEQLVMLRVLRGHAKERQSYPDIPPLLNPHDANSNIPHRRKYRRVCRICSCNDRNW